MNKRKWLGRMLVLAACAPCARSAPPGYADPTVCAACHRQISESYAKTGMGRSFRSASAAGEIAELESVSYDHEASREHFSSERRDNSYYIRRTTAGVGAQPDNLLEERVDYLVGSGEQAVTYLHRTQDDQLVEIPITRYGQNGGFWGMSPAYDRPDHPGFGRTVSYRCMFCHNGYPDVAAGPGNWDGATVFPAKLPEGIDCQRCHGPGAAHVAAATGRRPVAEIRAAIVNPARLTPERQMEVCMQCHLETTSAQLPGAIMRFGRGVFSYQPGAPLSDYALYFDHAPGTGHDDKFEFVSAVYRLRKSACFNASQGRLTCIACHDPHRAASREEELRKTNQACVSCHEARVTALVSEGRHVAARDCATCHMPLRRGADALKVTITDHMIQLPSKTQALPVTVEQNDGNVLPYAGEVVPYYPRVIEPLYIAIAQVNGFANLPTGLTRLEKLLSDTHPQVAAPYYELGAAYFAAGQPARAIPAYQEAVRLEPGNWRCLYGLAQALQAVGKVDQAIAPLERAVTLAPYETSLLQALGIVYALAGRDGDAVRILRDAVKRNPEEASAQSNLGQTLARANNPDSAETAIREAVRLRPESGFLRVNLAEVLMHRGQLGEAAFELGEVIRSGPSSDSARSAWFAGLAVNGNVAEARSRYDESLRKQISEAHDNLGTVLLAQHNVDGAIREYRLAVDSDPRSAPATLNLGLTLGSNAQPTEARRWLEESLRLDTEQPVAHLKLGELLFAAGLRSEALAHWKAAATSSDSRIRAAAEKLLESAR